MIGDIIDLKAARAELNEIKSDKKLLDEAIQVIQDKISSLDEEIELKTQTASIRAKVDDQDERDKLLEGDLEKLSKLLRMKSAASAVLNNLKE